MRSWFEKKEEKKEVWLHRECRIEIASGYCSGQTGFLPGSLLAAGGDKLLLELKKIYYEGLFLFDLVNSVCLTVSPRQQPVPVIPISYKTTADGYHVFVQVCERVRSENEEQYREILDWLASLKPDKTGGQSGSFDAGIPGATGCWRKQWSN